MRHFFYSSSIFLFGIFPIIFGFYIYLVSRSNDLLYLDWLSLFPSIKYSFLAYKLNPLVSFSNEFVIYSLPTALWAFSFGFMLLFLNFSSIFISFGAFFIASFELGQLFGFLSGTFDFIDLISSLIAFSLPFFIFKGGLWPNRFYSHS